MALIQECPKCGKRLGLEMWVKKCDENGGILERKKEKVEKCECGFKLGKAGGNHSPIRLPI
jgi:hypothetical protein